MNTDTLSIHSPINDFVKIRPDLMPALQKLNFDICCGGHKTLSEACSERKLDANSILAQLLGGAAGGKAEVEVETDWSAASLAELTDHLEKTHHVYLREVEPRLDSLLKKVIAAHGQNHPELKQLEKLVKDFWNDMTPHLMKEEQVLFPLIRAMGESLEGPGGFIMGPIKVMRHEHEIVARLLDAMSALTNKYTPPADGCGTYGSLMETLKGLDTDTRLHLHKENDILFPRALES